MTADTSLQNQKKRTMEALERRFALADAELHLQQQKNKKRPHEEKCTVNNDTLSSSTRQAGLPPSHFSSKKGKFSSSGQSIARDVQASDPVYFQLSHAIDENLKTSNLEVSSKRGNIIDSIMNELRQNGDSSHKYMQGSRIMKRDEWILLDNLVQGRGIAGASQAKALRSLSKRSKKHMSMKQHKKFGSLDLPQELHNFETYKPMHEMWAGYIKHLLKNVGKNELARCLLRADLHGAIIQVAECKVSSFTGVSGIMIRETAETFGIITRENKFRVLRLDKYIAADKAFGRHQDGNCGLCDIVLRVLCRKSCPFLCSKLIVGRLHSMETSSLQEILANDDGNEQDFTLSSDPSAANNFLADVNLKGLQA